MQSYKKGLVWIRRDYRLTDNTALINAVKQCDTIIICFIYDKDILNKLKANDQRIPFIMNSIREIDNDLTKFNTSLIVKYGIPKEEIVKIVNKYEINALFYNRDYEPYAKKRDNEVKKELSIPIYTFKDSVIHEKSEIKTNNNGYYTVFTPYKNKWLNTKKSYNSDIKLNENNFFKFSENSSVHEDRWYDLLGFNSKKSYLKGGRKAGLKQLQDFTHLIHEYDQKRDFPSLNQTSKLSPYLRFGCISIRECVQFANQFSSVGAKIWLSEIIWRDFYQMVCDTFPECDKKAIKPIYDKIKWEGKESWFNTWTQGKTGFPIIDAAMRELNNTGLMHNRCRMITASFLCKTLLIDWRQGEKYFAEKLLDFEFASNNGGWQWSSSSGCDAQPYFRIFNPYSQSEKFDSNGDYIRKYCPELADLSNKEIHNPPTLDNYPKPIVNYKEMRERALNMYSVVKK